MDGLHDALVITERMRRDGLARDAAAPAVGSDWQQTLKGSIGCVGVGLHSGKRVHLTLHPAPVGSGIRFRRLDLAPGPVEIAARFDRVMDTRLCTLLASDVRADATVGTVEHVMAALAGAGIDNALIEIDGPEVPILDGSAAPFLFLIDCAGTVEQDAPRRYRAVQRVVRVSEGDAFAELRPHHHPAEQGLDLALSIAFDAPAIGRQALSLTLSPHSFRHDLARARTFTLLADIAQLQASGRALGGSLDNAVVVDAARVLNPGGLRMPDEFVRHKLLDAVGDLALAGGTLHGRFVAHRTGHALNNRLLHALFADPAALREMPPRRPDWRSAA